MTRTLSILVLVTLVLSILPSSPMGSVAYGATIPVVCLGANDATLRINPAIAAAGNGDTISISHAAGSHCDIDFPVYVTRGVTLQGQGRNVTFLKGPETVAVAGAANGVASGAASRVSSLTRAATQRAQVAEAQVAQTRAAGQAAARAAAQAQAANASAAAPSGPSTRPAAPAGAGGQPGRATGGGSGIGIGGGQREGRPDGPQLRPALMQQKMAAKGRPARTGATPQQATARLSRAVVARVTGSGAQVRAAAGSTTTGPGIVVFDNLPRVTITGFTITGFNDVGADNAGGAILVAPNTPVTIADNNIQGNAAARGGGIALLGNNDGSIIRNNVIRNNVAYCDIACSSGNYSGVHSGGGLWVLIDVDGLELRDNWFENNIAASGNGGAIWLGHDNDNLIMTGNTCKANVAYYKGGCMQVAGKGTGINAGSNPRVGANNGASIGGAGALRNSFRENLAYDWFGGAINWGRGNINPTFTNNEFKDNYSLSPGGAINVQDENGKLLFTDNEFKGNLAGSHGGAVRLAPRNSACPAAAATTFTNNLFQENASFSDSDSGAGGGVYAGPDNGCMQFVRNRWYGNSSAAAGGALAFGYAAKTGVNGVASPDIKLDREEFVGNSSGSSGSSGGGALHLGNSTPRLEIVDSLMQGNHSNDDGGAINDYEGGGAVESRGWKLTRTRFISNSSSTLGGAIYLDRQLPELHIDGALFDRNAVPDDNGGALYFNARSDDVVIERTEFLGNMAGSTGGGGAIYADARMNGLIIRDATFRGNKTPAGSGGALFFDDASDRITIGPRVRFESNLADCNGGAVHFDADMLLLRITESDFVGNSGGCDGGAVYFDANTDDARIERNLFKGNKAGDEGGALAFTDGGNTSSRIEIDHNRFEQNTAYQGGGVALRNDGTNPKEEVSLHHNWFEHNAAASDGGALLVRGDNPSLEIFNSVFTRNTAGSRGGSVVVDSGGPPLTNNQFFNNTVVYGSAPFVGGVYVSLPAFPPTGFAFWNNISYLNQAGDLSAGTGGAPLRAFNSMVGIALADAQCELLDACLTSNPLFQNATGQNFDLTALSPAIDLGTFINPTGQGVAGPCPPPPGAPPFSLAFGRDGCSPVDDYSDTLRVGLPDAGAYTEVGFASTATRTPVPSRTSTPTGTLTATSTPTATTSPTITPCRPSFQTQLPACPSQTAQPTGTGTVTPTPTPSRTPTRTAGPRRTPTPIS